MPNTTVRVSVHKGQGREEPLEMSVRLESIRSIAEVIIKTDPSARGGSSFNNNGPFLKGTRSVRMISVLAIANCSSGRSNDKRPFWRESRQRSWPTASVPEYSYSGMIPDA